MSRVGLAATIVVLALIVGAYAWSVGRPTQLTDIRAAEECRAYYARARTPAESAAVDRHRADLGRRSAGALRCGELRARGRIRPAEGER